MKHIRVAVGAAVETVETGVCVVVKTPGVVAVNKEINLSGNCTHICFK